MAPNSASPVKPVDGLRGMFGTNTGSSLILPNKGLSFRASLCYSLCGGNSHLAGSPKNWIKSLPRTLFDSPFQV